MHREKVLLSLGANLGKPDSTIESALLMIESLSLLVNLRRSRFYKTAPIGYTEQPSFCNMCVSGYTTFEPEELRNHLTTIEQKLGRQVRPMWHEREIDIDILLYGDSCIISDTLIIPHPRMHQRAFVLVPASEIEPDMIIPTFDLSILDTRSRLSVDENDISLWSTLQ